MIPLINVVFLLLIFFMLAGTFKTPEPFAVEVPKSMSSDGDIGADPTWVYVGVGGRLAVDQTEVGLADLPRMLRVQAGEGRVGRVLIKADAQVGAGRLFEVMTAVQASAPQAIELVTHHVGSR